MKLLLLLTILFSCSNENKKITLIKQWHLSPKQNTLDIEKSKKLPQYENQKEIYKKIVNLIETKKTNMIIAEGCEGEIDEKFTLIYNGWSLKEIKSRRFDKNFNDIMAPIPLKIKAKYPNIKVVCGDNLKLIDENLKAISDLRGFSGFYQRLRQSKGIDEKKYLAYKKQLDGLFPNRKIKDPVQFSLNKSLNSLRLFEDLIVKRNNSFFDISKKYLKENPVIVIGGLHVKDLETKFDLDKILYETIIPNGYKNDEQSLVFALKEILLGDLKNGLILFQVPNKFRLDKFPTKNQMKSTVLFSKFEKNDLSEKIKSTNEISIATLLSDYDKDGVRDFTLSTNGRSIILSAEDQDWDNDGIDNIIDNTIGDIGIAKIEDKVLVGNQFLSKSKEDIVLGKLSEKVKIIQESKIKHELLVLEILNKLMSITSREKIGLKYIMATTPKFAYGENVFFSYIQHTQVMEYYPEKLNLFVTKQYRKRFSGVKFKKFIQLYVIPLIIHSLSHEIAHSLTVDPFIISKKHGWKWDSVKYKGKYLKSGRHPKKVIKDFKQNVKFQNKTFKEWMKSYTFFSKAVNKIVRIKDKDEQNKNIGESDFYVNIGGSLIEHKLSFLYKNKVPSLYSLKNPSEWFAEAYATCIYKFIYPASKKPIRSVELEHLLGMNPSATEDAFCSRYIEE